MAGGAVVVAAGGPASLFAVRVASLLVNTSASITITNTAPAIHPHGVGEPHPVFYLDRTLHIQPSVKVRLSVKISRVPS